MEILLKDCISERNLKPTPTYRQAGSPSPLEGEGWVGGKIIYCVCIIELRNRIVMELIFGVISWGRGGFSLPISGRLKSPLPMKER